MSSGGLSAGSGIWPRRSRRVEESVKDEAGQHEDQGLVDGLVAGGEGDPQGEQHADATDQQVPASLGPLLRKVQGHELALELVGVAELNRRALHLRPGTHAPPLKSIAALVTLALSGAFCRCSRHHKVHRNTILAAGHQIRAGFFLSR